MVHLVRKHLRDKGNARAQRRIIDLEHLLEVLGWLINEQGEQIGHGFDSRLHCGTFLGKLHFEVIERVFVGVLR